LGTETVVIFQVQLEILELARGAKIRAGLFVHQLAVTPHPIVLGRAAWLPQKPLLPPWRLAAAGRELIMLTEIL
jgi:hypothetical protein